MGKRRLCKPVAGSTMRHRWSQPVRPDPHHTNRVCECGAVKVTRHEGDEHWVEYWDGDRRQMKAPPCSRGERLAP